ncbi:MAG: hypothetical protein ACLGHP_12940, partial [Vicinamibacteria bacterium]
VREAATRTLARSAGEPELNALLALLEAERTVVRHAAARALVGLGAERAWVVHGADGLDELSTTGYTKVSEARDGTVRTFYVHPAEFGLAKASIDALRGGDAAENAAIIRRVMGGERGAPRDAVLLNAGAALFVAGHAADVRAGIAAATAAIDEGRAADVLDRFARVS